MTFRAAEIDVLRADVDLLIVGMSARPVQHHDNAGVDRLDHALHGTLSRLRQGGIFAGAMGETLMLSTPPLPVTARSLMLIGLGDAPIDALDAIVTLTVSAMDAALRSDAQSAACLVPWAEVGLTPDRARKVAAAMMAGAIGALAAAPPPARPLDWTFDSNSIHADVIVRAFTDALLEGDERK